MAIYSRDGALTARRPDYHLGRHKVAWEAAARLERMLRPQPPELKPKVRSA